MMEKETVFHLVRSHRQEKADYKLFESFMWERKTHTKKTLPPVRLTFLVKVLKQNSSENHTWRLCSYIIDHHPALSGPCFFSAFSNQFHFLSLAFNQLAFFNCFCFSFHSLKLWEILSLYEQWKFPPFHLINMNNWVYSQIILTFDSNSGKKFIQALFVRLCTAAFFVLTILRKHSDDVFSEYVRVQLIFGWLFTRECSSHWKHKFLKTAPKM